jgi:glycosyltransferase involved in cell wall biosynthesis
MTAPTDEHCPLTVVMPVYNEQEAIVGSVEDVQRHVLDRVPGAELIVVDDGSRDGSGRILDRLAAGDGRIRVIHQQNSGHGGALMTGLSAARGSHLFLVDSDNQVPLDAFAHSWDEVRRGRDAAFGVRVERHDPGLRLALTRLIRAAIRLLFGVRILDANVPYKLLKRRVWEDARAYIPEGTLAPSLFLSIFAFRRGYDVIEVDVPHRRRATGEASIRRVRLLKFCAKAFRQLIAFRRDLRRV